MSTQSMDANNNQIPNHTGDGYPSSYSLLDALFGIGQVIGPLVGGIAVDKFGLMQGIALTVLVLCVAALFASGYGIVQHSGGDAPAKVS